MLMNPNEANAAFQKQYERFAKLCPFGGDPMVVLLKGHLLLEEMLFEVIRAGIADAAPLEEARLTFAQTLRIARASAGQFLNDLEAEAIGRINKLRNSLAHSSEADIAALSQELIEWAQNHSRFDGLEKLPTNPRKLYVFISSRWASLTGVRDALLVVREQMPLPMHRGRP